MKLLQALHLRLLLLHLLLQSQNHGLGLRHDPCGFCCCCLACWHHLMAQRGLPRRAAAVLGVLQTLGALLGELGRTCERSR